MFFFFDTAKPLHESRTDAKESVVLDDNILSTVVKSAKDRACRHPSFSQYTELKALKGMLRTRRLYLTLGSEMNDLNECNQSEKWKRTYVACFSHERRENVAMWWMYGYKGASRETTRAGYQSRIPLRLTFQNSAVLRCLVDHIEFETIKPVLGKNAEDACSHRTMFSVSDTSFHDVLYRSEDGAPTLNKNQKYKLPDGQLLPDCEPLTSYVKDAGWLYEKETRFAVFLKQALPCVKRISIPIDEMLESMSILVGPCDNQDKAISRIRRLLTKKQLADCQVETSSYHIQFPNNISCQ